VRQEKPSASTVAPSPASRTAGSSFVDALGEVTGQLSRAERQALDSIPPGLPTCESAGSNPAASF